MATTGAGPRLVSVSTARLETFADGVFAIAATLLILNVDSQVKEGSSAIGHQLVEIVDPGAIFRVGIAP